MQDTTGRSGSSQASGLTLYFWAYTTIGGLCFFMGLLEADLSVSRALFSTFVAYFFFVLAGYEVKK